MPVIDLTKTDEHLRAMAVFLAVHEDDLAEMGYSVQKDGWELCEYIAYHCLGGKYHVSLAVPAVKAAG